MGMANLRGVGDFERFKYYEIYSELLNVHVGKVPVFLPKYAFAI
jgi:hypothetical protein